MLTHKWHRIFVTSLGNIYDSVKSEFWDFCSIILRVKCVVKFRYTHVCICVYTYIVTQYSLPGPFFVYRMNFLRLLVQIIFLTKISTLVHFSWLLLGSLIVFALRLWWGSTLLPSVVVIVLGRLSTLVSYPRRSSSILTSSYLDNDVGTFSSFPRSLYLWG